MSVYTTLKIVEFECQGNLFQIRLGDDKHDIHVEDGGWEELRWKKIAECKLYDHTFVLTWWAGALEWACTGMNSSDLQRFFLENTYRETP